MPGSTLMYGSSFCIVTRRPRDFRRRPSEEAVRPFPRLEATPPVTKMCFAKTFSFRPIVLACRAKSDGRRPYQTTSENPRIGGRSPLDTVPGCLLLV